MWLYTFCDNGYLSENVLWMSLMAINNNKHIMKKEYQ